MKKEFIDPQAELIILLNGDIITDSQTDYFDGSSHPEDEAEVELGL